MEQTIEEILATTPLYVTAHELKGYRKETDPFGPDGLRRVVEVGNTAFSIRDIPRLSLQSAVAYFFSRDLVPENSPENLVAVYELTDANDQGRPLVAYAIAAVRDKDGLYLFELGSNKENLQKSMLLSESGVVLRDGRALLGVGDRVKVASLLPLDQYVRARNNEKNRVEPSRPDSSPRYSSSSGILIVEGY